MAEKRDDAQRVDVPSIVHDREIWAPTVYVTASRDWLVEGYLQALDRFRAVDGRAGVSEKEAFWPLFEALNWAATIQEFDAQRGEPIEHPVSRRFVRNTVHHDWAAALETRPFPVGAVSAAKPSTTSFTFFWCWKKADELPPERRSQGETEYREHLAEKHVRESLEQFAALLGE
jgi:hypothetical protein